MQHAKKDIERKKKKTVMKLIHEYIYWVRKAASTGIYLQSWTSIMGVKQTLNRNNLKYFANGISVCLFILPNH